MPSPSYTVSNLSTTTDSVTFDWSITDPDDVFLSLRTGFDSTPEEEEEEEEFTDLSGTYTKTDLDSNSDYTLNFDIYFDS
ncbi:MAG: hypothetical protein R6X33_03030, partial [Candidatus Brocadiia bacterium]